MIKKVLLLMSNMETVNICIQIKRSDVSVTTDVPNNPNRVARLRHLM